MFLGQDIDPRKAAGTFGMGVQQMIEIAKAVLIDAKMIIMDEPTSSLVHAGNARGGGLIGVFEDLPLSVDIDLALVRHVDAGENLNQRGFARATPRPVWSSSRATWPNKQSRTSLLK